MPQKFNIYLVAINDFFPIFDEIICCMQNSLIELGHACTVSKNEFVPGAINLFIGSTVVACKYQNLNELVKALPYAVYQLEQLGDHDGHLGKFPEYLTFLRNASLIFEYSPANFEYLKRNGYTNVYYLPPGYHRKVATCPPIQNQDIDVLFFGAVYERRVRIMEALRTSGVNTLYLHKGFGQSRNRCIQRAKIILNVHAFDYLNVLETFRLSFVLSNRGFVISENSDHNPYGDGVVYAPYENLVAECLRYLQEPRHTRAAVAQKGQDNIKSMRCNELLKQCLVAMGEDALAKCVAVKGSFRL